MSDSGSSPTHASQTAEKQNRGESIVVPIEAGPAPASPNDQTVISAQPLISGSSGPAGAAFPFGERLEGERLGHFDLIEFIGGGGMGAVYRATDTMLNRTVAVKVLTSGQPGDEETQRRFKNEAQSAARLDHQHIARVYYVGEDRGVHYIVFEYVEGVNVRDLVEQHGPLSLADAVNITIQIADALGHASQRDVVHRDIKPSNVILTSRGKTKLVDMGLARLHHVEHTDNDLTASGVTLGTFDYISPEQARDPRTADVRSDLYSLGCTLFFMLTGRPPFPEGTVLQKLLQHQGEEPPSLRDLRSDLPAEIDRIVQRLLAKSPQKRYQTPGELIVELVAFADRHGLPHSDSGSALAIMVDRSRRRGLFAQRWARHLPWAVPVVMLFAIALVIDRLWSADAAPQPPAPLRTAPASAAQLPPADLGDDTAPIPPADNLLPEPDENAVVAGPARQDSPPAGPAEPPTEPLAGGVEGIVEGDSGLRGRVLSQAGRNAADPSQSLSGGDGSPAGRGVLAATPADDRLGAGIAAILPESIDDVAASTDSPPAAARSGILIVSPDAPSPAYRTLAAACAAAQNGDVIELRFDGPQIEQPIRLTNIRLTVRAGEGFRPRIVFQPGPNAIDPVKYPRAMLSLATGSLSLLGVDLELVVPQEATAEHWTLFRSKGAGSLRLEDCWLTIQNTPPGVFGFQQQASFFDITAPAGESVMPLDDEPAGETRDRRLELRLENCIARGGAGLLRATPAQSFQFIWEQGLLVTNERLLSFQRLDIPERRPGEVQLELRHLTASLAAGFLLAETTADRTDLPTVRVQASDNIFQTDPAAIFVEQRGVNRVAEGQARFTWNGDRNFYENVTTFWEIVPEDSGQAPLSLDYQQWSQHWNEAPQGEDTLSWHNAIKWRQPLDDTVGRHEWTPGDFALDATDGENPARGAASNGRDVGIDHDAAPSEPAQAEDAPDETPATEPPSVEPAAQSSDDTPEADSAPLPARESTLLDELESESIP